MLPMSQDSFDSHFDIIKEVSESLEQSLSDSSRGGSSGSDSAESESIIPSAQESSISYVSQSLSREEIE